MKNCCHRATGSPLSPSHKNYHFDKSPQELQMDIPTGSPTCIYAAGTHVFRNSESHIKDTMWSTRALVFVEAALPCSGVCHGGEVCVNDDNNDDGLTQMGRSAELKQRGLKISKETTQQACGRKRRNMLYQWQCNRPPRDTSIQWTSWHWPHSKALWTWRIWSLELVLPSKCNSAICKSNCASQAWGGRDVTSFSCWLWKPWTNVCSTLEAWPENAELFSKILFLMLGEKRILFVCLSWCYVGNDTNLKLKGEEKQLSNQFWVFRPLPQIVLILSQISPQVPQLGKQTNGTNIEAESI